jgi:hypothetical protein
MDDLLQNSLQSIGVYAVVVDANGSGCRLVTRVPVERT